MGKNKRNKNPHRKNRNFGGMQNKGPANEGGHQQGGGGRRGSEIQFKPYRRLHKKNIYQSGYRINSLVEKFPEFAKYVEKKNDKFVLDFNDKICLHALTKYSLRRDFGIDVVIPTRDFVPNIPFRVEFILWIKDLLELLKDKKMYDSDNYHGVELVTGSGSVYPVISATINKNWNILNTEIKCDFGTGMKNVKDNRLKNRIIVKAVDKSDPLLEGVLDPNIVYDFCTYAPKYFKIDDARIALGKVTDKFGKRVLPDKKKISEEAQELLHGGEMPFVMKLVTESERFKLNIRLYCVLVGRRSTAEKLLPTLKEIVGEQYVQAVPFCYGPTTHYGIVWTYYPEYKLRELCIPEEGSQDNKQDLSSQNAPSQEPPSSLDTTVPTTSFCIIENVKD